MKQVLFLFLSGGLGSLCRFWLSAFIQRSAGIEFPVGTFLVNLLGCLIFGFVWSLADSRRVISEETRLIILSGFVGAFTTFSTFAFETHGQIRDAAWLPVLINIGGQVVLGIVAVGIGIAAARWISTCCL